MKSCFVRVLAATFILLGAGSSNAANQYVRAGASGSGTGDDWVNAHTALPSTLLRGNTYYIAGGTYSGRKFNTPASGTLAIVIKGATAADHGTDTGWQSSYSVENSRATWTSPVTFTTSYWVFDGSVGSLSKNPNSYGFAFSVMNYPIYIYNTSNAIQSFVISHIAATAPSADTEKFFVSTSNSARGISDVTISHNYLNGWQALYWATTSSGAMDNWTAEYNVALNGFSSSAHHGGWINNNYGHHRYQVTRYNLFEGHSGSSCMTGIIVANNADNDYAKVYGNVFNDTYACNGTITGTSQGNLNYAEVYNNTFVNAKTGISTVNGPGRGNVAYNNLMYNSRDYDGRIITSFNVSNCTAANNLVVMASPFVGSSDFHLQAGTAPINAGRALGIDGYINVDMDGAIRGADGAWDTGAYEFSTGNTAKALTPPQGLTATEIPF